VLFAVVAHIGEEQVAEHHALGTVGACLLHRVAHRALVHLVRARSGELDPVDRDPEPVGLELEQLGPHRVHRDPLGVGVERHQEPGHLEPEHRSGPVQREGAVLAAAPAHPGPHCTCL
jgi:hypothetical protein